VKIAVTAMVANIVLTVTLGLYSGLAQVGIALATSTAGWVNALGLIAISARRRQFSLDARSRRSLPRILLAAMGMGAALIGLQQLLEPMLNAPHLIGRLAALTVLVGGGMAAFAVLCLVLGVAHPRELRRMLGRRREAATALPSSAES
jgi:putative peptidoglycan lipid II flippase